MTLRDASLVARRCLLFELLLQRLGLETDDEDDASVREDVRRAWVGKLDALGLSGEASPDERVYLERPVGALTEDDLDDLHGRASGAVVLLWALGRIPARPTRAAFDAMESLIVEHGLLEGGKIASAKAAVLAAKLRPEAELAEALAAYERTRGKSREADTADKVVAEIAADCVAWILDPERAGGDERVPSSRVKTG